MISKLSQINTLLVAFCFLGTSVQAQIILTSTQTSYTQNFDGMGTTGTTFVPGWTAVKASGSSSAVENGQTLNILITSGSATSGAIYNVGNSSDRAFGSLASGSVVPRFGASFVNNTGKNISSIQLKGIMEQWRSGSNAAVQEKLPFEFSFNAANISDAAATWEALPELDLIENLTATTVAASVDGNEETNRTSLTANLKNIAWPNGSVLWIRWTDKDDSGSDGIYAIDDFELATGSVIDMVPPVLATANPFLPESRATQVDIGSSLEITFSEPVARGAGTVQVKNVTDNTVESIDINAVAIANNRVSFSAALLGGKQYDITLGAGILKDMAGNDFAGIAAGSWTFTTSIPSPFTQSFNTCLTNLPGGWTQFSIKGDEVWTCTPFGQTGNGVQINGFASGAKENEDWLISPAFNLSTGFTYPLLSFSSRGKFGGEPLKLMISTNYSGTGSPASATWKELNGQFPALDSDVWVRSENINLSRYKSAGVYIAFIYTSTTSAAARWTVDDIAITNSEVPPPPGPVYFISSISPLDNYDFGFVGTAGPSVSKSFTFSALDLRNDLTLTAPANFELSKNNAAFATSLTYSPEAASETNTVYVRFANQGTKPAAFAGPILFSSQGFSTSKAYLSATTLPKSETLDVVTWNIEWFGHASLGPADNSLQLANAKKIILEQDAEVYCFEEIVNESLFREMVKQLPGYRGFLSPYVSGTPGPNTQKVGFLYKTSVIDSITTRGLLQSPSNVSGFWASGRLPYLFVADATVKGIKKRIHFIAIHAKANENNTPEDASDAYNRRISDLKVLKDSLDLYYPDANIMMLGDFNDDVDFTVANVPATASTYSIFTNDAAHYTAVTRPLSDAGLRSYIAFENVIDHVLVSDEMALDHLPNSSRIIIPFELIQNYQTTTSDHLPVTTRFVLQPNVHFAQATATISEEAGQFNIRLNLTRASAQAQTLAVQVTPGAGVTVTDFGAVNGNIYKVTIPAGETIATLPVSVLDDNAVELSETLTFGIVSSTGGYGFRVADTFTLTVQDNDASVINFASVLATISENAGSYEVALTLDQPIVTDQTVAITITNGAGAVYGLGKGMYYTTPAATNEQIFLTIPAGATQASFVVVIGNNSEIEPAKTISFALSQLSEGLRQGTTATFSLTISDTNPELNGPGMVVFPNPSYDLVRLYFQDETVYDAQDLSLTLWNSKGQIILTVSGNLEAIVQQLNQKLDAIAAGMYILKVVNGTTSYQQKIIRQ